ncbi:MAG TPA: glutaminyl-peptide cyclotransferase, partial [Pyrinomonadaceae bacterium]|nr:glutaminyl-peptide cyclotransferase [Pyrinomonadaceae bacterium]
MMGMTLKKLSRGGRSVALSLAVSALAAGCESPPAGGAAPSSSPAASAAASTPAASPAGSPAMVQTYTYEVVNRFPHDPKAFTQGLVFDGGEILESTGQYGESTLRRVEPKTGKVIKSVKVEPQYFGEGLTLFGGKIYQLTWTTRRGFIYDPASFERLGEFSYDGEGWGLTHDGESLILSDGTSQLRFLDPATFKLKRAVNVTDEKGRPVRDLNELEHVKGEIFANIWHSDRIARINPSTGRVTGWIDLAGLMPPTAIGNNPEAVLNGIAYDEAGDRL